MKRFSVVLTGLIIFPAFALAQTGSEINAGIEAVIKELEGVVSNLPSNAQAFCYDFDYDLEPGAVGEDMQALHLALEKEGYEIYPEEKRSEKYGDTTLLALYSFQNKYADEILTPLGLEDGTGSFGPATRAKLNALYGCSKGTSSNNQVLGAYTTAEDREESGLATIIEIMSQILDKLGELLGR